jgi:hypothetical protein
MNYCTDDDLNDEGHEGEDQGDDDDDLMGDEFPSEMMDDDDEDEDGEAQGESLDIFWIETLL